MGELTVRLEVADGVWETCGVDRMPGVLPESLSAQADAYGPSACSFQLHRPPGNLYPDLFAFTPCEVEVDGVVVWEGRVKETPSSTSADPTITVSGEGRQFELDDDMVERYWVQSDLSQWRDQRTFLTATLSSPGFGAAAQVSADLAGALLVGWANGTPFTGGDEAGTTLDRGAAGAWEAIAFTCQMTQLGSSSLTLKVRFHDGENAHAPPAGYEDVLVMTTDLVGTAPVVLNAQASRPHRYVTIMLAWSGAAGTTAGDYILRIPYVSVYASAAHMAWDPQVGPLSTLKATDVLADAISSCCPKLKSPQIASSVWQEEALGTPGLKALYRLQETANTGVLRDLAQASGAASPMDASLHGTGYSPARPGLIPTDLASGAASFTGAYATAALPFSDQRGWFLEAVFEPTLASEAATIVAVGTAGVNGFAVERMGSTGGAAGNGLYVTFAGHGSYGTGITLNQNVAYHVFAMYTAQGEMGGAASGSGFTVFCRGSDGSHAIFSEGPASSLAFTPTAPTGGMSIAARSDGTAPFTGVIDEIAVGSAAFAFDAYPQRRLESTLNPQPGTVRRTGFSIPTLAVDGPQTPRTIAEGVNAYHGWRLRILPGGVVEFAPQPAAPIFEVGAWGGSHFDDAAANSGADVYNKVIVEGTDPAGNPLRYALQTTAELATDILVENGVFDDLRSTAGWSVNGGGSLSADNTLAQAGGWSLKWLPGAANEILTGVVLGEPAGRQYVLQIWLRPLVASTLTVTFGYPGVDAAQATASLAAGAWSQLLIPWSPQLRLGAPSVQVAGSGLTVGAGGQINVDSALILSRVATVLDRRGYVRTKTLSAQNAIDPAAAQQIAAAFLDQSTRTPGKGTLTVTAAAGMRRVLGGEGTHPSLLLLLSTELVRMSDRVDPDTGAHGRDGIMAQVTYNHQDESAAVQIDNSRVSFEALLARMAIVTGQ